MLNKIVKICKKYYNKLLKKSWNSFKLSNNKSGSQKNEFSNKSYNNSVSTKINNKFKAKWCNNNNKCKKMKS